MARQQAYAPARRGIAAFLITLAVTAVLIPFVPARYESRSKLFVQPNQAAILTEVVASTIPASLMQGGTAVDVRSVVEMLASQPLAEEIVAKMGTGRILKDRAWFQVALDRLNEWTPWVSGSAVDEASQMSADQIEQQRRLETAVNDVMRNMTISSPPNSRTISIRCRAGSANLAQEIARSLLDEYQRMQLASTKSPDSLRFLEENFAEHERILKEYEDAMRLAKNEMQLITMAGKQHALQQRITQIETDISQASAELEAARASLLDFIADMDRLPAESLIPQSMGTADTAGSIAQRNLMELQLKEREMVAKYKQGHPLLIKLQQQLSASQDLTEPEAERSVSGANPVRLDVHKWLLEEKANIAGIEAKLLSLKEIESDLQQQLQQINLFEVKSSELQRKMEIANANYMASARMLDRARLQNTLSQEFASNVAIVQQPTFGVIPTSPRLSTLGAFALCLALPVGLTIAYFNGWSAGRTRLGELPGDQSSSASKRTSTTLGMSADHDSTYRQPKSADRSSRHQLELFSGGLE